MDENTERDTHFQNAAKLLLQQLMGKYDHLSPGEFGPAEKDEQIIAHFAYDLVYYLLDNAPYHSGSFDVGWGSPSEIREAITGLPDMTEWPAPQDE